MGSGQAVAALHGQQLSVLLVEDTKNTDSDLMVDGGSFVFTENVNVGLPTSGVSGSNL